MSKTKSLRIYDKEYPSLLKYPFKSKYKFVETDLQPVFKNNIETEPFIPDFKLKACKKISKPNFSNEPGTWEADLMFSHYYADVEHPIKQEQIYLVLINVNTRYLIVEPMSYKSEITQTLKRIVEKNPKFEFKTIKCDGESGFVSLKDECIVLKDNTKVILKTDISNDLQVAYNYKPELRNQVRNEILFNTNLKTLIAFLKKSGYKNVIKSPISKIELKIDDINDYYPVKFVINSSPYALAHKNVDSVIRTIRNAFGMDNRRIADYNLMRQMVNFYNNTPHNSLRFRNYDYNEDELSEYQGSGLVPPTKWIYYSPVQVQNNVDLEWRYIRMMKMKLRKINEKQKLKGLLNYKRGNIILIHLDKGKTQKKHEKRRRVFDDIAEFICYQNGNVKCRLLNQYHTFSKTKDGLVPYEKSEKGRIAKTDDEKAIIEVPIIYTKYVCDSIEDLNDDYKQYFILNVDK